VSQAPESTVKATAHSKDRRLAILCLPGFCSCLRIFVSLVCGLLQGEAGIDLESPDQKNLRIYGLNRFPAVVS
jgi:hypothetical protein